jgi:cytochrome c peroxidase
MLVKLRAATLLAALFLVPALAPPYLSAHKNHAEKKSEAVILAPGYQALNYDAPTPGTYELPIIKHAPDARVTTHKNQQTSLHELLDGQVGILSFIYTTCDDVNGCPLASFVLSKIDKRIQQNPKLSNAVKLLSVSFDYDNDSTETLASYAKGFASAESRWAFLRANNQADLNKLLENYDQSIVVEPDGSTISHILRVYLIDKQQKIRNVYSVSFLHAETLLSDIETVLDNRPIERITAEKNALTVLQPNKLEDYPTQSSALDYEVQNTIDLADFNRIKQIGLPDPNGLINNAGNEKINLGKKLFFDRRLSHNDTISCAMCHIPEQGFTSNELSTAIGIEGRTVRRNTPTLLNVAYMQSLFLDARETSLEQQVWSPLLARNEMANPSIGFVLDKLKGLDEYRETFTKLFPQQGITMHSLGAAIAAYERSLTAADSRVDHMLYTAGDTQDDADLVAGLALFRGKGGCADCHSISENSALFTDQKLHNTGIGYLRSMGESELFRTILVAPGESLEVHRDDVGPNELDTMNDLGRYEITEDPADRWKYRTPSLRNIALTAPYMHNGSLATLREVVQFYNVGGVANPELDSLIKPLGLSKTEVEQLVYFLRQLTSPHVDLLVKNARSTPIGERK